MRHTYDSQMSYQAVSIELKDWGFESEQKGQFILEIGRNFGDFGAESLNGFFQSPVEPHFSVIPGIAFLPFVGYPVDKRQQQCYVVEGAQDYQLTQLNSDPVFAILTSWVTLVQALGFFMLWYLRRKQDLSSQLYLQHRDFVNIR